MYMYMYVHVQDWVMRRITADEPKKLTRGLTARLEDCDFAERIKPTRLHVVSRR